LKNIHDTYKNTKEMQNLLKKTKCRELYRETKDFM